MVWLRFDIIPASDDSYEGSEMSGSKLIQGLKDVTVSVWLYKQLTQYRPPPCLVDTQTAVLWFADVRDLRCQAAADRVVCFEIPEIHDSIKLQLGGKPIIRIN